MIIGMIVVAACFTSVSPAATVPDGSPTGDTYAIIVNGIGKDTEDLLSREQVVNDLRAYLKQKAFVTADRLVVLSPAVSTAERIKNAVDALARTAVAADRFVFYYIGQANAVGDSLRLNLPGPDITEADLARWLAGVKATTQLIVLDCPHAAKAAKALARPGRATVLATTAEQAYAPRFGLHFVPALDRPENDTNQDGGVSVLEAFTAAAREIEQWYQQMQLLPTETPCLEDNGDGRPSERPWRYEQDGGDGRLTAGLILTSRGQP